MHYRDAQIIGKAKALFSEMTSDMVAESVNREIQGAESRLQVEEAVGGETESMRVFRKHEPRLRKSNGEI